MLISQYVDVIEKGPWVSYGIISSLGKIGREIMGTTLWCEILDASARRLIDRHT